MERDQQIRKRTLVEDTSGAQQEGVGAERRVSGFEYDFAKSYLFSLFSKRISNPELEITRCLAHTSLSHRPQVPSMIKTGPDTLPIIPDGVLESTVIWQKGTYEINISKESQYGGERVHTIYSLALSPEADAPLQLTEYILQESVAHSFYRNRILTVTWTPLAERSLTVRPVNVIGKPLSKIILRDDVRDVLELFIQTTIGFPILRKPLRLLLEGPAGTGKTESIRAVIQACKDFATFLIVESNVEMTELFDFANLFSPCVIVLDDLDLIFGNRHDVSNRESLAEFLMLTDGVSKSSVFMLATINNKKFLDQAAARPCRWEYIIDTGAPHPSQYMTMIKERCNNETVVDLFTEAVCRTMEDHNVSGAFIINLLGHLELTYRLNPEKLSEEYVISTVERMHKSFYRAPEAKEQSVGFVTN
jgi:hypothetical protein